MEKSADLKGLRDLPESQRKEFSGQVDLQGHNPPPHPLKHFLMGVEKVPGNGSGGDLIQAGEQRRRARGHI